MQVDIPVMVAVAVACLPIFANGYVLNRWEGIAFLVTYAGYLAWLVLDATEHGLRDSYGDVVLYFVVPIVTVTDRDARGTEAVPTAPPSCADRRRQRSA